MLTIQKEKDKRDREIIKLTKANKTSKEISQIIGCSERTVVRVRKNSNCMVSPAPKKFTNEELQRAKKILDEGGTYSEALKTIGRHRGSIQSLKKKLPGYKIWTRKESSDYAALVRKLNKLPNYPAPPRPGTIGKGPSFKRKQSREREGK